MDWDFEDLKDQVKKMQEEQNTADAKALLEGVDTDDPIPEPGVPEGAE